MKGVDDQNVLQIQTAQRHLHVETKNVLILVIVLKMLIAHREITEGYAYVGQILRVIPMELLVHPVRILL
jgi:hypothetical protein